MILPPKAYQEFRKLFLFGITGVALSSLDDFYPDKTPSQRATIIAFEALKQKDYELFRRLLGGELNGEKLIDANAIDENGNTLLMNAIKNNAPVNTIMQLINQGADITARNQEGLSALEFAVRNENVPLTNLLIDLGAKITDKTDDASPKMKLLLFERRMGRSQERPKIESLDQHAISYQTIETYINQGGDVNALNKDGRTLLEEVVSSFGSSYYIVNRLLEAGAYVGCAEVETEDRKTLQAGIPEDRQVMMMLCYFMWTRSEAEASQMLRLLKDAGLNLDAKDKEGKTIFQHLLEATDKNGNPIPNVTALKVLLSLGVEATDEEKAKAERFISEKGKQIPVYNFWDHGIQHSASEELFKATLNPELLKKIEEDWSKDQSIYSLRKLTYQDFIDTPDKDGNTPLIFALKYGDIRYAKFLIEKGANVHHRNKEGKTALHYAIEQGRSDVIYLLKEKGVSLGELAQSTFDLSKDPLERESVQVIGARDVIKTPVPTGENATEEWKQRYRACQSFYEKFEKAIKENDIKAINACIDELEKYPDLNLNHISYKNGNTLIHQLMEKAVQIEDEIYAKIALQEKEWLEKQAQKLNVLLNAIEILKSRGADINAKDAKGRRALDIAIEHKGASRTVKTLRSSGASTLSVVDDISKGIDRIPEASYSYVRTLGVSSNDLRPGQIVLVDVGTGNKKICKLTDKEAPLLLPSQRNVLYIELDEVSKGWVYLCDSTKTRTTEKPGALDYLIEMFTTQDARPGDKIRTHPHSSVLGSGVNTEALFDDLIECAKKGDSEGFLRLVATADVINSEGSGAESWQVDDKLNSIYGDIGDRRYKDGECGYYIGHEEKKVFQHKDEQGLTLLGHLEKIRRELIKKGQPTAEIDIMMELAYKRNAAVTIVNGRDFGEGMSTTLSDMARKGDGSAGEFISESSDKSTDVERLEALLIAIEAGDVNKVLGLLNEKPPLNLNMKRDENSPLPIELAIKSYRDCILDPKLPVEKTRQKMYDFFRIMELLVANGAYTNVLRYQDYVFIHEQIKNYSPEIQEKYKEIKSVHNQYKRKIVRLFSSSKKLPYTKGGYDLHPIYGKRSGIVYQVDETPYPEAVRILIEREDAYSLRQFVLKGIPVAEIVGGQNRLVDRYIGRNALHVLVKNGDLEVIKHLKKYREKEFNILLNQEDNDGRTPVDMAISKGDNNIIEFFANECKIKISKDILVDAITRRKPAEEVLKIIELGASLTAEFSNGKSVFRNLDEDDRGYLIKDILERIDLTKHEVPDDALFYAIKHRVNEERVLELERLISSRKDLSKDSTQMLEYAVQNGYSPELVERLLEGGVCVTAKIFQEASSHGATSEVLSALLSRATKEVRDELFKSIGRDEAKMKQALKALSPEQINELVPVPYYNFQTGWATPLELAVFLNDHELMQNLIEKGAKVDDVAVNKLLMNEPTGRLISTNTLYLYNKTADVLFANIDKNDVNKSFMGEKPLDIAIRYGCSDEVKASLIEKGADLPEYQYAMRTIIREGNIKTLTLLLKKGMDISKPDRYGDYALHIALYYENKEMLELLIQQNSNLNVKNKKGQTPLDLLQESMKTATPSELEKLKELEQLLIENGAKTSKELNASSMTTTLRNAEAKDEGRGKQAPAPQKKAPARQSRGARSSK